MPTQPDSFEFLRVPAVGHDGFHVPEAETFSLSSFWAILAFAVIALHGSRNLGQFVTLGRVFWRRQSQRELQKLHLARCVIRQINRVEATRRFGEFRGGCNELLIRVGGEVFGVIGDKSALHPIRATIFDVELKQSLFCIGDKLLGFRHGGLCV